MSSVLGQPLMGYPGDTQGTTGYYKTLGCGDVILVPDGTYSDVTETCPVHGTQHVLNGTTVRPVVDSASVVRSC